MEENLKRAVTNIENPTPYKRYKILYGKNVMVRIKLNHVAWTAYVFLGGNYMNGHQSSPFKEANLC
jgi:hypothetical protein